MHPLVPLILALSACTVGPGGSFPDTGGSATVAMTASSTASSTATSAGTGDVEASSEASGDQPDDTSSDTPDPSDDSTSDAPADTSSAVTDEDTSVTDLGSSSDGTDTASGTPLDPDLDIPDGGEQCDYPGDLQSCPGIAVCRFATAEYGLCESCDACGNLFAPCVEGTDCDILFSCYAGSCTNFCTLGTFECGPVEDCLDIGHPTRGVCDPFA